MAYSCAVSPYSMKATLYDALGISPTSSDEEVRAALRGLIRKYYAKTRDGQGNVEEALRFINHASRILSDSERRERYDHELTRSTEEDARAIGAGRSTRRCSATTSTRTSVRRTGTRRPERRRIRSIRHCSATTRRTPPLHHPGLTERVASFGRSPLADVRTVRPLRRVHRGGDRLRHAVGRRRRRAAGARLADRRVPRARRRLPRRARPRLRAPPSVERAFVADAADRPRDPQLAPRAQRVPRHQPAAGGRVVDLPAADGRARAREVGPHERAAAVAPARARGCSTTRSGDSCSRCCCRNCARSASSPTGVAYWLTHPLLAPIVITASWMPIEALLITSVGTTPGKWLFGIYLQFSISDAYARRDTSAQLMRGFKRALRVWCRRRRAAAFRCLHRCSSPSPTRSSPRTRRPTGTSPRIASSRTGRPASSTPSPACAGSRR